MTPMQKKEEPPHLIEIDEAQRTWADLEYLWRHAADKQTAKDAKKAAKYLGRIIDRQEAIDREAEKTAEEADL